jgi:hypothetical protein
VKAASIGDLGDCHGLGIHPQEHRSGLDEAHGLQVSMHRNAMHGLDRAQQRASADS